MNRVLLLTLGLEPCGQIVPYGVKFCSGKVKFLRSDVLLRSVMCFALQNVNGRSAPIAGLDIIRPQQGYGSHNIIGASATVTFSLLLLTYNLKKACISASLFSQSLNPFCTA